jgi:myotubularin-related protein 6/7/8
MLASTNQLYAFYYEPGKAEKKINSWGIYHPEKEFARMGLGSKTNEWRISHVNKDYSVCVSQLLADFSYVQHTLQY